MSDPTNSMHLHADHQSAGCDENVQRALAEREHFLKQHPHLQAYQNEIDRLLDLSGDSHGRLAVLGLLMEGKLHEIKAQFERLRRYLHPPAVSAEPIANRSAPAAPMECCGQHCY